VRTKLLSKNLNLKYHLEGIEVNKRVILICRVSIKSFPYYKH
jgi:hypothetical protein